MRITVPLRGNGRRQTEPRQRGIVRFTEMPQVVLQFAHFPLGLDIFGVERLRLPCQLLRLGDYHRQIGNDLAARLTSGPHGNDPGDGVLFISARSSVAFTAFACALVTKRVRADRVLALGGLGSATIPQPLDHSLAVQFGKYALNRGFYWLQLRACRETSSRWSP